MLSDRLRQATRTLRFRLMVWNAIVIALTASVVLWGLRTGVRVAVLHELDRVLTEDVLEIEYALTDAGVNVDTLSKTHAEDGDRATQTMIASLERKARGHQQHGWFVQLYDERGTPIWSSENAPREIAQLGAANALQPLTMETYRLVHDRGDDKRPGAPWVQVGASTEFIGRDMARIDRLVAMGVAIVLIAGPLIGYWLAGRAIEPLATIIQRTARLRPARLDERLPLQGTGDELDQLARTINGFLNRIAAYLEQRRDFLANAAHELRTPLAAIRSTVEVALAADRSGEDYRERLVEVIEECSLLEVLVNQLLLLAETESDRLRIHGERVDLSAVVERAIGMFQAVAEAQEVRFSSHVRADVMVEGNAHHLRQVVNNLLDNAIKFTPAGGSVTIRCEAVADAQALLAVSDTGPGIAAADVPYIFDRFFRGDRARRHEGGATGTGLGLSICQAIVEAHGGTIRVDTQMGRGTTFTVHIPLAPELAHPTAVADGARA